LTQRHAGTDVLEKSVEAFQAALEEWSRERVPMTWAKTMAEPVFGS